MAAYITRADLEPAYIQPNVLRKMLDEEETNGEKPGLLDAVFEAASRQVDAFLTRYAPPLAAPNAFVKRATVVLAGFELYRRKGMAEAPKNPFAEDRDRLLKELERIHAGELDMAGAALPEGKAFADVAPAVTHLSDGGMMF